MTEIIDGKGLAKKIRENLKNNILPPFYFTALLKSYRYIT